VSTQLATVRYERDWLQRYALLEDQDPLLRAEMAAFEALAEPVLARAPAAPRLLDVGACTGRYSAWGVQRGLQVHAVDRSSDAVAHCRRRLGQRAELLEVDVADAPSLARALGPRRFDLVIAMLGTINHFGDDERERVLRTLAGHLEPGGAIVLSTWPRGQCDFSLYAPHEQQILGAEGMDHHDMSALAARSGLACTASRAALALTVHRLEPQPAGPSQPAAR
jgi:2-polyprenyl-3-methyl-5-hydroxy-6-metoxy-1,4-benzoquinol methylase